jgi:hypothetical protein
MKSQEIKTAHPCARPPSEQEWEDQENLYYVLTAVH